MSRWLLYTVIFFVHFSTGSLNVSTTANNFEIHTANDSAIHTANDSEIHTANVSEIHTSNDSEIHTVYDSEFPGNLDKEYNSLNDTNSSTVQMHQPHDNNTALLFRATNFSNSETLVRTSGLNEGFTDKGNAGRMFKQPHTPGLEPTGNPETCRQLRQTVICQEIPASLPPNVTSVVITGSTFYHLISYFFTDKSWHGILILEMKFLKLEVMESNCFVGLDSVQELTLNGHHLKNIDPKAWNGLKYLRRLVWTGISKPITPNLEIGLANTSTLPLLETFIVNPVFQFNHKARLNISPTLARLLEMRPLKCFNASNVFLIMSKLSIPQMVLKLEDVNLTNSIFYIAGDPNQMPQSTFKNFRTLSKGATYLLKSLDISGLKYINPFKGLAAQDSFYQSSAHLQRESSLLTTKCNRQGRTFGSIEKIYANNFEKIKVRKCASLTCTGFNIKTKLISLQRNGLVDINLTVTLDPSNSLEVLDLSENGMKYLSPKVLITLVNLQKLFLSQNKLYYMQSNQDFLVLFQPLVNLQVLVLDNNGLSNIPYGMFRRNNNLQSLILSSNHLETITFDLTSLVSLTTLDLRYNRIHSIDSALIQKLDFFIKMRRNNSTDVHILLQNNPLDCNCKAVTFIEWYLKYSTAVPRPALMSTCTCSYHGSMIQINADALKKCNFLCFQNTIIACAVTVGAMGTILVISAWLCHKNIRKRSAMEKWTIKFTDNFQAGRLKESYLVFVAMSSNDEDFVMKSFLPLLQERLQHCIKATENIICTGYDFRPGFPIVVEAHRIIQASCVMVAMVSNAFCHSNYCKMEIHEACNQRKPLILISLEDLDEDAMSPFLLDVFKRNTRAKIVQQENNRHFDMMPTTDCIAESIITLAVENAYIYW